MDTSCNPCLAAGLVHVKQPRSKLIAGIFTKACAALQAYYRQSSRELRRLSNVARSPVYSGFSEAIDGAPTIRGFSAQAAFSQQNIAGLEVLQRANYAGMLNPAALTFLWMTNRCIIFIHRSRSQGNVSSLV